MKKLLLFLLFLTFVNTSFSQDFSDPRPLIYNYNSSIDDWVPVNSTIQMGCGVAGKTVKADFASNLGAPTEYEVTSIDYRPKPYLRALGGTVLAPNPPTSTTDIEVGQLITLDDDWWSPAMDLTSLGVPLEFCFFGQPKNEFIISENGAVSFNTAKQNSHDGPSWMIHTMGRIFPNANLNSYPDSILMVLDTFNDDPSADFDAYYFWRISGPVGERTFTLGYHNLPLYRTRAGCGSDFGTATVQMIFYETTNIIEFHTFNKPVCTTWNGSKFFAMGIQNNSLTKGYAAPGRDNLDSYQIINDPVNEPSNPAFGINPTEAWRFTPSGAGAVAPEFGWYLNWTGDPTTSTLLSNNLEYYVDADTVPYDAVTDTNHLTLTAVTTFTEYCSGAVYYGVQEVDFEVPDRIRGHIKELNSPDNDVEFIENEVITLCVGDDYLLEPFIFNHNSADGVSFDVKWTVNTSTTDLVTDTVNTPYQITNIAAGNYIYTYTVNHGLCSFSDSVEIRVIDSATMEYPSPKIYCSNANDDPLSIIVKPQNVYPFPSAGADQATLESYYYVINNGGVWANPLASDPTRSLDGIPNLHASLANATTVNPDGSAVFEITYHIYCTTVTQTDTITIRSAPRVLNPAIGNPTATPIIIPSDLIMACQTNTTLHTADFDIAGINNYIANGIPLSDLNIVWERDQAGPPLTNPMPAILNTTAIPIKVTVTYAADPTPCEEILLFNLTPIIIDQVANTPNSANYIVQCERIISGVGQNDAEFLYNSITNEILSLVPTTELPDSKVVFEAYTVANDGTETPYTLPNFETDPSPYYLPSLLFKAKIRYIYNTYIDPNTGAVYVDPNTGEEAIYYCESNEVTFNFEVRDIATVTVPSAEGVTAPLEDDAVLTLCETNITNHTAEFDTSNWNTIILSANVDNTVTPAYLNPDFEVVYKYTDISGVIQTRNDITPLENPLILTVGLHEIKVNIINKNPNKVCAAIEKTFNLTVKSIPIETPLAVAECSTHDNTVFNVTIDLSNHTTLSSNTYTWYAEPNANAQSLSTATAASPETTANIQDRITNTSLVDQTVVYHVIPTSENTAATGDPSNACEGIEFTIDVIIHPEPVLDTTVYTTPLLTCSDVQASINLDTITTLTGNTYSWEVTDNPNVTGETLGVQTGNMITETLTNTSTANQDVVYTITPTSSNNCVGETFTVTINVGVEPEGTDPILTVCSFNTNNATSLNIDLDDAAITTLTGNTFSWEVTNNTGVTGVTAGISTAQIITDSLTNTTSSQQTVTYTVTPTSANNCVGNDFTVTIMVNPEPVYPITTPLNACSDIALNIDLDSMNTNTLSGVTYSWTATASGTVTGVSANGTSSNITDTINNTSGANVIVTYIVTPTSASGCVGETFEIVVTVGDEPIGTAQTPTICSDDSVNLDLNTIVNKTGTTFSWIATDNPNISGETLTASNSSSINDNLNNVSGTIQTVTYTVTPTNGCTGDDFTVIVTVNPEPVGATPSLLDACSDIEFTIDLNTYTTLSGNTYQWQAIDNINVTGETTTLTTNSIITDTIINTSPTPQTIIYEVTPISSLGCTGNLFTIEIEIGQKPVELTATPPLTPFCSNEVLNIDLNTFTTLTGNTYEWYADDNTDVNVTGETTTVTSGDTITDAIVNKTTTTQQITYHIIPTSANNCLGDEFTIIVNINPQPIGNDNIEETACSDVAVDFNLDNYTSLSNNTYVWIATDNPNVSGETVINSTNSHITDTLTNASTDNQVVTYTITPTSADGCVGDSFVFKVTVAVEPVGSDTNEIVCSDDDTFRLNLNTYITNLSSNDYTFSWYAESNNFVSGETTTVSTSNTISDILHNVSGVTQFVKYHIIPSSAAPNNCEGNEFIITVEVGFEPVGTTSVETICNNEALSLNLDNYTIPMTGNTHEWYAIDNPNVTGETTVTVNVSSIDDVIINTTGSVQTVEYMITPISTDGCRGDEFLIAVDVNPRPEFELEAQYLICPDVHTVTIGEDNDNSYTYHWYNASDTSNIIIGYDEILEVTEAMIAQNGGTYVLKVTDTNGCTYSQFTSVSMAEQVIIAEVHVSDFNRPDNTITIGVTGGSGAFEYTLTYNDYAGSSHIITQNSPVFENLPAGTYQIEVLDVTGCSVTIISNDIYVLDYPPFFTPNGDLQNDTWQITGAKLIPNSSIYVFDRFGKILAQINPNSLGWDGTYNGIQVPASDYWFTAEYLDPNTGNAKSVKGNFSIIRK